METVLKIWEYVRVFLTPETTALIITGIITIALKIRSKLTEREKVIEDLAFLAFNYVNSAKKYVPKKYRKNFDATTMFLEKLGKEYIERTGRKLSARDVIRAIGIANRLHYEKKALKKTTKNLKGEKK